MAVNKTDKAPALVRFIFCCGGSEGRQGRRAINKLEVMKSSMWMSEGDKCYGGNWGRVRGIRSCRVRWGFLLSAVWAGKASRKETLQQIPKRRGKGGQAASFGKSKRINASHCVKWMSFQVFNSTLPWAVVALMHPGTLALHLSAPSLHPTSQPAIPLLSSPGHPPALCWTFCCMYLIFISPTPRFWEWKRYTARRKKGPSPSLRWAWRMPQPSWRVIRQHLSFKCAYPLSQMPQSETIDWS